MTAVKYQTSKNLKEDIGKGKLDPVYLLMGEEEGEKEKCISMILDALFENVPERSNCVSRFHIENNEFTAAAEYLLSQSIFYPTRACIMNNVDALKPDDPTNAVMSEIFQTIRQSMTLIMTTRNNNPPNMLTKKMMEKTRAIQFWRYFDKDIEHYIALSLAKLGLSMDRRTLELLVELTGKDIKKIDDAIDMLRNSSEKKTIDEETLRAMVHDQRDSDIFEFIDALFVRNKKALQLLEKIITSGTEDLFILNMILKQCEKIELFFSATEEGKSTEEALTNCGVYQRKRDLFWKMTRAYDRARIRKVFPLIARADYELKSGKKSRDLARNPLFNLTSEMIYSL